jgi:hypothetical protein
MLYLSHHPWFYYYSNIWSRGDLQGFHDKSPHENSTQKKTKCHKCSHEKYPHGKLLTRKNTHTENCSHGSSILCSFLQSPVISLPSSPNSFTAAVLIHPQSVFFFLSQIRLWINNMAVTKELYYLSDWWIQLTNRCVVLLYGESPHLWAGIAQQIAFRIPTGDGLDDRDAITARSRYFSLPHSI